MKSKLTAIIMTLNILCAGNALAAGNDLSWAGLEEQERATLSPYAATWDKLDQTQRQRLLSGANLFLMMTYLR